MIRETEYAPSKVLPPPVGIFKQTLGTSSPIPSLRGTYWWLRRDNGRTSTDASTWMTYAEASPDAHKFSGVGVVMGAVEGIHLGGVDLDNCCDAVTGKFTPESR